MSDRFDLHTHSTASDGLLAPRDVVALAVERGLGGIALTDHDTVAGIEEAQDTAVALGIRVIAGIELSARSQAHGRIDLLGLFVNPRNVQILNLCKRIGLDRLARADAICAKLRELGVDVSLDDVLEHSGGRPPARPHIAEAMVAAGAIGTVNDAFTEEWIGNGGRALVRGHGVDILEAIRVVHAAGGIAVFAHPGRSRDGGLRAAAIEEASRHGLDAIEVDHPDHTEEHVRAAVRLADELALAQTAGSDDHARGDGGSQLGCRTVSSRVVDALERRAMTHRV